MEPRGRLGPLRVLLLLCCLLVRPAPAPAPAPVRHPLPVLWMMPVGSGSGRDNLTASVVPAVRLALQDLQRQPPPLGHYEIQLLLLDSQCDPAKSLKALFDAMWAGPKYLLLFGGVCPSVTSLIARSLPALDLVQVSFAAPPPSLSNRKLYGNFFSTAPSDGALNRATVKLLQRHQWSRVGVITEEGARLSEMKEDLLRQLLKAEVQVVSTESLSEDVCSSLKRLKESDVRIIVGQFEEDSASEVFCCAYRLNLFGARYQWIVVDGGAAGWRLGGRVSGCTADSLQTAADGSIRLQVRQLSDSDTPGASGRTPQDYQDSFLRQLGQEGSKVSPLHAFAYDAVWVAAKALSQVTEAAKLREKYGVQRNGSAAADGGNKMLLEAVRQTQFEGVTGPVFFQNGERMTSVELIQFQGSSGVLVGEFSSSSQQLRLMNHRLKFKGPGPARDRTLVLVQRQQVSLLLYGVVSSAAAVTVVVTLTVLFLTVVLRRHRLLRWSGGSQDELLLLGILLSSSSVLISGLDGASLSGWTSELLCSVRLWTLSVGHTVGFAVLFTKTWRLYRLCCVRQKSRLQPAGRVVLWMLLLDVFVLTSWQILDPLRRVVLQHRSESDPSDQDVVVRPFSEHCSSINMELWLTAVYGYKGPLLGLGCFVAWSVRAVRVDPPAVSGHVTLSVFAVTAFSVTGASASLLTSHNPPVHLCVTGALVLCCDICTLSWMFGPQMLKMLSGSELQSEAADGDEDEDEQLSRLNEQLKSQTAQLDVEIETITMQLCETCDSAASDQRETNADLRSVMWTHVVQVCSGDRSSEKKPSSPDDLNAPEHVWRRLSMQLPILHHSYLPAVGGISASSSSLFGSREAFIHSAEPIRRQL